MNHDQEKLDLELAAVQSFLLAYNAQEHTSYQIKDHRDRPDFVLVDGRGAEMALEVTHFFDSEEEARDLLHGLADTGGPYEVGAEVQRLNALLAHKAQEATEYDFPGPVSLLVRIASPYFDVADFRRQAGRIKVPSGVYQKVWLLFRNAGGELDPLIEIV